MAPRFVLVALLAVGALVIGTTGSHYLTVTPLKSASKQKKPTTKKATPSTIISSPVAEDAGKSFVTDPPPALLDPNELKAATALINSQKSAAAKAIGSYWASHGTSVDDAGFVTWAATQIPPSPVATQRQTEIKTLEKLKSGRSAAGLSAARWLDRHGSQDVWRVYLTSQTDFRSGTEQKPSTKELDVAINLANKIAGQASSKAKLSAPYIVEPTIKDDQKSVSAGATCPCSYPSSTAARSAAAVAYLGALSPERRGEYAWMQSQVNTGELYRADAYPSDLGAGTFIGDLVSTYVLVTRGHANP
ncbi:MAG: hypothetical protein JWQ70_183 [Aeromicrobium sp.]|nr:hypothetical protein [Aeromicrobium sp.]